MTRTISRWGDKMLTAVLPRAKASACSRNCRRAYVGCGGGVCVYYYEKYVSGSMYCFRMREDSCYSTAYGSRPGCC
jgi:hypothetical protein